MFSFRPSFSGRLSQALLLAGATFAVGAHAAGSTATPMCQSIQTWVSSDARTTAGVSADDVAGALLGPRFAQVFGKDYAQLTIADFRVLRDQGVQSCSRTGVLQAGQLQIASALLSQNYQTRWLRNGGGQSTLSPATLANSSSVAAPAQLNAAQPGVLGGGRVMPATLNTSSVAPSPAMQATTANTTSSNQGMKGIGSDLRSSFTSALSGMAGTAMSAGTQAVSDRVSSMASGMTASPQPQPAAAPAVTTSAAPSCPSAADMEVIRRTGSKPPAGC